MNQSRPALKNKPTASILAKIRNKIFIGAMLAIPVMASVWIFKFLLQLTNSWLPKTLFPQLDNVFHGYLLQVLALLSVLVMFYLLGLLAHHFFGKQIYKLADRIFSGIPFVNRIYLFVRHVCGWVAKRRSSTFESVVLVEYPRRGIYTVGLVTSPTLPVITSKVLEENGPPTDYVNVFISTTPYPPHGMLISLPKKEVIKLDMDVAAAMNLILSAGAFLPQKTSESNKNSIIEMIDHLINTQDEKKNSICPPEQHYGTVSPTFGEQAERMR